MAAIKYVNTDLELRSSEDLSPLVDAFGEDALVMYQGFIDGYKFVSFEVDHGQFDQANETIALFCDLIEAFPQEIRNHWNRCARRTFDIGLETSRPGRPVPLKDIQHTFKASVVARVASLDAELAITVYPAPSLRQRVTDRWRMSRLRWRWRKLTGR